jgi:hypothetical protein
VGHERRFGDVRDKSGLPPTPDVLRHRSELTLRAHNRTNGAAAKFAFSITYFGRAIRVVRDSIVVSCRGAADFFDRSAISRLARTIEFFLVTFRTLRAEAVRFICQC